MHQPARLVRRRNAILVAGVLVTLFGLGLLLVAMPYPNPVVYPSWVAAIIGLICFGFGMTAVLIAGILSRVRAGDLAADGKILWFALWLGWPGLVLLVIAVTTYARPDDFETVGYLSAAYALGLLTVALGLTIVGFVIRLARTMRQRHVPVASSQSTESNMQRQRRRVVTLVVASALSAGAGASIGFATVNALDVEASAASQPVPAASTPVDQVAKTYLQAAHRRDCKLTHELTSSHTWSWCSDPELLDHSHVDTAHFVSANESDRNQWCVPFDMKTNGSDDGTISSGIQPWSLCFIHTHNGWRLWDQGQG